MKKKSERALLDRAKRLSYELDEGHKARAEERLTIWRELRDRDVTVSEIADACEVSPMAVRKALGKAAK